MPNEPRVYPGLRSRRPLVELADRQGQALGLDQLRALDLEDDEIEWLVRKRWLAPVHRGVLRLGALTERGVYWAAHLAVGEDSAISHISVAHLRKYTRGRRRGEWIHVTAPKKRRKRKGILPHQAVLDPDYEISHIDGLPVCTVARMLLDIAAAEKETVTQRVVDAVRIRNDLRDRAMHETIKRAPGHHGIKPLRKILAIPDPGRGPARSDFEIDVTGFLRDHRFPPYVRNMLIEIDGEFFMPDIVWPEHKVYLEIDSREWHGNEIVLDGDRREDRRLGTYRWLGVRATETDFSDRPQELADDIWARIKERS